MLPLFSFPAIRGEAFTSRVAYTSSENLLRAVAQSEKASEFCPIDGVTILLGDSVRFETPFMLDRQSGAGIDARA